MPHYSAIELIEVLIAFVIDLIVVLSCVPSEEKAVATATAIRPAATAYSESDDPVSSLKKFLIVFIVLYPLFINRGWDKREAPYLFR